MWHTVGDVDGICIHIDLLFSCSVTVFLHFSVLFVCCIIVVAKLSTALVVILLFYIFNNFLHFIFFLTTLCALMELTRLEFASVFILLYCVHFFLLQTVGYFCVVNKI